MTNVADLEHDVETAARDYEAAQRAVKSAYQTLVGAIAAAVQGNVKQTRIVEITSFSREHIRRLTRKSGIAAD